MYNIYVNGWILLVNNKMKLSYAIEKENCACSVFLLFFYTNFFFVCFVAVLVVVLAVTFHIKHWQASLSPWVTSWQLLLYKLHSCCPMLKTPTRFQSWHLSKM